MDLQHLPRGNFIFPKPNQGQAIMNCKTLLQNTYNCHINAIQPEILHLPIHFI